MYLINQYVFSFELVKRFDPSSAHPLAVCSKDDLVLRELLERHEGCSEVVYSAGSELM